MCNESRVTCIKKDERWLCHKYDVNYMIMHSNMTMMEHVIINGTVESCMAILLGFVVISKKFLCTRKIMVMHSNERRV